MSTRARAYPRRVFAVSYQSVDGRSFKKKGKKTRRRRVARTIGAGVDFTGW